MSPRPHDSRDDALDAAPPDVLRGARALARLTARGRREALGLAVLLLTIVPAHLASRTAAPPVPPPEVAAAAVEREARAPERVSLDEIHAHIQEVAARYDLSPRLIAAIIEAESEFNPRAVSRKGARGLMQLMPETAASLQVAEPFDPFENIEGGVRHLRALMDRFNGNLPLVLAAYNAGEQAVAQYRGVPPYRETRRYVARIMRRLAAEPRGQEGAHR